MVLTDEDIIEYQGLVKARFGLDISKEEALEDALSLINFVRVAYRPVKKKDENETEKTNCSDKI
jgi:hypothetical protein